MANINKLIDISIFPNPVENILTISGVNDDNVLFKIVDIYGKLVSITRSNSINVSFLKPGIYYIELMRDNKTFDLSWFIKT